MELKLNLGKKYHWNLISSSSSLGKQNKIPEVNLIPIAVKNLHEHESVVQNIENNAEKGYPSIGTLQNDILNRGFLHPVLTHYLKSSKSWVLADGTHRLNAMRKLHSRYILGQNLKKGTFKRDFWIKIFQKNEFQNWRTKISNLNRRFKNVIAVRTLSLGSFNDYLNELEKESLLGIINTSEEIIILENKNYKKRQIHLAIIKELDSIFDSNKKDYVTKSEISGDVHNFLALPPPLDKTNDMFYLTKYEHLRRTKGSRTVLNIRVVHFPVPFNMLQLSEKEIYVQISEIIDQNLEKKLMGTVYLQKSIMKTIDPSWYNHSLFIGNFESFLNVEAKTAEDKIQLEKNFKLITEL